MTHHTATRVFDLPDEAQPRSVHCGICRGEQRGDDGGRTWRLTTPGGDDWGYAFYVCEADARDIADMAAAIELALAIEHDG